MGFVDLGVPWDVNVLPYLESTVGHPLPNPSGWGQPGTPRLSASCVACSGRMASEGVHGPRGLVWGHRGIPRAGILQPSAAPLWV